MTNKVKIRGIDITFDGLGKGDVIVLIHGQPFNRSMWDDQAGFFSKTNRLIIPDLRGYGESGITAGMVLLDELALDIIYLLESLNIEKAVFIGLSMGGQIALDIFRLRPGLFRGLVLADTDARAENEQGYLNRINLSKRILADGMIKFTDETINQYLCKTTFDHKPGVVDRLRTMMAQTNPIGAAAVQRGRAERRDHSDSLKTIDFPTMIIVGQEDEFTPLPVAKYMHDRISDSVLRSINDAGHMPNMEQPDDFNHLIAELLAQISAKSSR